MYVLIVVLLIFPGKMLKKFKSKGGCSAVYGKTFIDKAGFEMITD